MHAPELVACPCDASQCSCLHAAAGAAEAIDCACWKRLQMGMPGHAGATQSMGESPVSRALGSTSGLAEVPLTVGPPWL